MSEDSEEDKNSTGWPEHKMGPWPEYVKTLVRSLWVNGMTPAKIAEKVNEMGVLSKTVHANTISQFMSATKRKDPSILEQRKENIIEFNQVAEEAAAEVKANIINGIKSTTLAIVSEVTDKLPGTIRETMLMLEQAESIKDMREASVALKIQVDVLSKLSGVDIAQRLNEYRGKKEIDLEFAPKSPDEQNGNNATPAVVPVEGWVIER